jgi:hypothetical protein
MRVLSPKVLHMACPAAASAAAAQSPQGWLGRSDHVLHQGEGTICAVNWHSSTLVWANDVGVKVSP